MSYIDFYLVPVPRSNKAVYEKLARISEVVLRECGATRVLECWMDESGPEAATYHGAEVRLASEAYGTFARAASAASSETVVLSFVEWPDKAARDAGMHKVTSDPRMQFEGLPQAFDGSRLIAGGFKPMLDTSGKV